jgi:hypothetical protein
MKSCQHSVLSLTMSAILFVAMACCLSGCGGDTGPKRIHVSGNVTWKGQKIPSGFVSFNPDTKKGSSGPQGLAKIKDGRFDSRVDGGRGVSPGALEALVCGFDGMNSSDDHPWGKPLFLDHKLSVTVADESQSEFNLEVPASVTGVSN